MFITHPSGPSSLEVQPSDSCQSDSHQSISSSLSSDSQQRLWPCSAFAEGRELGEYLLLTLLDGLPRPLGLKLRQKLYGMVLKQAGQALRIFKDVELIGTQFIELGNHVTLERQVQIAANATGACVRLGDRVMLDRGVDIRVVPGYEGCQISLGEGSYLGPYCCLAGPGDIEIGKNCMIASHCGIYANNHVFMDPNCPIADQGITRQGIVIEDDCWLGAGVKVMDGVRIGRGCVVGAGAVVTKDLPPYTVAVGVPARPLSRREMPTPLRAKLKAQLKVVESVGAGQP